jgi:hypothetical protein
MMHFTSQCRVTLLPCDMRPASPGPIIGSVPSMDHGQLYQQPSERYTQGALVGAQLFCSRHWFRRLVQFCVITMFWSAVTALRTNTRAAAWMTPIPAIA